MADVIEINGPLVVAHLPGASIGEQVKVGELGLMGDVIGREGENATIQVYESTEMVRPGDEVLLMGYPLSVELGPGLLGNIFDGVQRPLEKISDQAGDHIPRGLQVPALDRDQTWSFTPNDELKAGMQLSGGEILGTLAETRIISHRILVPPDSSGELLELAAAGEYRITDTVARLRTLKGLEELRFFHRWPVRKPRPYRKRDDAVEPLLTGQRILDTFFPLLKGGKGAVPGPFGAGKTMVQQQIARWSNADIVIYVGCGERGNELVDILETFPELQDPHSGHSLMERTLIIANTSNMPVVAREASIYVGITIAEYYRDQGLDVVMVADSTSRWAEALREVAGRLGQMPVEEGYPAYLGSRLAAFYERAGRVESLAGTSGSVTLIGAVSPPGGDFSEPVTNHTKEIIQTFWALSKELADARHYPAVSWTESFSEYVPTAARWWSDNVAPNWEKKRKKALGLLAQAEELSRIVNLVGAEALSPAQRWALESAGLIKEGVLQQSALDEVDSFCSPEKQFALMDLMLTIYDRGLRLLKIGVPVQQLNSLPLIGKARRCKSLYGSDQLEALNKFVEEVRGVFDRLGNEYMEEENRP